MGGKTSRGKIIIICNMDKFREINVNKIWVVLVSDDKKIKNVVSILYFCGETKEQVENYFLEYHYKDIKNAEIKTDRKKKSIDIKYLKQPTFSYTDYYLISELKALAK